MKLVLIMILVGSSVYAQDKPDLKKLHWLNGTWERTNLKPGRTGEETWTITSEQKLTGSAVTKQDGKVIFEEKLQLVYKDSALYYVADVTGNTKPVWFKLTEIGDRHFVCENPENDFPNKIVYTLKDDHLSAIISAGNKSIEYSFVKKNR